MNVQFAKPSPRIPHDVFHDRILPHILSEHLHKLLVVRGVQNWHAFHTLPLVSLAFHNTCKVLYVKIFGVESGSDIDGILTFAQSLWDQDELSSLELESSSKHVHQELVSGGSLIQVYICTAFARSFLNLDVLRPISLQDRQRSLRGHHQERDEEENRATSNDSTVLRVRCKLVDDLMHRVYLPFTYAIIHCDSVRPKRLAFIAADYLAKILPMYSTAPVLLKYAQDLDTYVVREHRVDVETWASWTLQTMDLIENTKNLLKQIHDSGRLVQSFSAVSEIPLEILEATGTIKAVQDVKGAKWGTRTDEIRARACSLLQEWGVMK